MLSEGKLWELECFGRVRNPIPFNSRGDYEPFENAMKIAKDDQPWPDPSDPKAKILRGLVHHLTALLNVDVKAFTAVGTKLDYFHGVDGWLEIGEALTVTIDLTVSKRPKRRRTVNADIVFHKGESYTKLRDDVIRMIRRMTPEVLH